MTPSAAVRPAPCRPRRGTTSLALLLVLLAGLRAAGGADDFKEQRKRYEAGLERPSLQMRQRARERLATTHDPRALEILAKAYGRPEAPHEQVAALIASLCATHFDAPEHLPALEAWRRKSVRPRDAWLWTRLLGVQAAQAGPDEVVATVASRRDGALRAAALEVLSGQPTEVLLPAVADLLAHLPVKAFDRVLLLESAAAALWLRRGERRTPAYVPVLEALIDQLDRKETAPRSRLVLARRLGAILGTDALDLESAPWRARSRGETPPPPPAAGDRYAPAKPPHFLGLDGTGGRIAYVIDLSDSMLTPLTARELEDLKGAPEPPQGPPVVTGPGREAPPRAPAPRPPFTPGAAGLPWHRIRTRFDAAREFLKLSLRSLDPTHAFCVVAFGTDAALLDRTPGMLPATPANVARACEELDTILPGEPTKERPLGTLRGYTNLHGGLQRAFQVKARGLVDEYAYVDPVAFEEGCDTLFLLSDGRPTWDDWPEWDVPEPEDVIGDPETGAPRKEAKKAHFYGPYVDWARLLDDLRRLNLFRKVEIHCIGLGEYDPHLLTQIVQIGLGRFRRIGGG